MKLYTSDNSELMHIKSIKHDGRNLVVEGSIMGAMPVRAIVKPAEIREALKLMSPGTMFSAFMMLFRGSR
ncbi:MAG: hypothetical protein ABWZ40_00530 [Caulobacterales bacterium]